MRTLSLRPQLLARRSRFVGHPLAAQRHDADYHRRAHGVQPVGIGASTTDVYPFLRTPFEQRWRPLPE